MEIEIAKNYFRILACAIFTFCFAPSFGQDKKTYKYLGAHGGVAFYKSPALETINARLGNSVSLKQPQEFGRNSTMGLEFLKGYRDTWYIGGTINWFGNTLLASSNSVDHFSVSSTLRFFDLSGRIGLRVYPWPTFATFKPYALGLVGIGMGAEYNAPAVKIKHLFFVLLADCGLRLVTHDYSHVNAQEGTNIAYEFSSYQGLGGGTGRLGFRFGDIGDLVFDSSYLISSSFYSKSKVTAFTLKEERLEFKRNELGIVTLSKASWITLQLKVGAFIYF